VFCHQRLSTDPNIRKVQLRDDVPLDSRNHRQASFKDPTQFGTRQFVHAVIYVFVVTVNTELTLPLNTGIQ
jgi:hypothetical protein